MRSRVPPLFALLLAPLATHAHPHAAQQDMLALFIEDRSNRSISRVFQNIATFAFLPI